MNKSENTKKRSSWGGNLGSTEDNEFSIMNRNAQLALCILNLAKLQNCYTKKRTHKIVTKNRIVKTYLKIEKFIHVIEGILVAIHWIRTLSSNGSTVYLKWTYCIP